MDGSKETKRRFFRKTGRTVQQRSSLESNASSSLSSTPSTSLESAMMGLEMGSHGPPKNSGSLDEVEIKMNHHRRFMAAPRRARSAERFDGMRVAHPGDYRDYMPPSHHSTHRLEPAEIQQILLSRNLNRSGASPSPQTARVPHNNHLAGVTGMDVKGRQMGSPKSMASPPPPYSSTITDITGPPSYRQAVAAMSMSGGPPPTNGGRTTSARYPMQHRATQSFDTSNYGRSGGTLRAASSVPAFTDDAICYCSKCQILNKAKELRAERAAASGDYNDHNDAVYMESQAFLTEMIMTDGIFCSIQ